MIPLNRSGKFRQGVFKPKNTTKYVGRGTPVYRSGWELKFFRWCDDNPKVVEWASESIIIPYINPIDGRGHRYFTDGVIALNDNGIIKKFVVEIKPSTQVQKPVTGKKKHSTMVYESARYVQNQAKWAAAKKWCEQRNYSFLILTEKELGISR